jgi:hypothetical protein
MADRGFTNYNHAQLTENELVETRRIASVRIHVERAIGRM